MKRWQDWLDSLSTKGGNIFIMVIIFFVYQPVMGVLMWMAIIHKYELGVIGTVILTTFGNFSGALLAVLSGNSSRQQMADRVDTATPGKGNVNVDKAQNVNVAQPSPVPSSEAPA